jgi:putative redox protein
MDQQRSGTDGASTHASVKAAAVNRDGLAANITSRRHAWAADEPVELGGGDTAPTPLELLMGALASCSVVTVRMYAARKAWPVREVRAEVEAMKDRAGQIYAAVVHLALDGDLDDAQRRRLREVAGKCPVHRALAAGVQIEVRAG